MPCPCSSFLRDFVYEYRSTGTGDGIDAHGNQKEIARFGCQDRRQLSVISASGINLFQKDRRRCGKRGDEMIFPSANAALRAICAVSAGRKILEGDLFNICEKCFEIGGGFCIQADKKVDDRRRRWNNSRRWGCGIDTLPSPIQVAEGGSNRIGLMFIEKRRYESRYRSEVALAKCA